MTDNHRHCTHCGYPVAWGDLGPTEYHDCKATVAERQHAPGCASLTSMLAVHPPRPAPCDCGAVPLNAAETTPGMPACSQPAAPIIGGPAMCPHGKPAPMHGPYAMPCQCGDQPAEAGDEEAGACAPLPVLREDGTWTIAGDQVSSEEAAAEYWTIICGLNARIAALKARKVKLPNPLGPDEYGEYSYEQQPLIAAIRAAGVEVES